MDPLTIIAGLTAATKAAMELYQQYEAGKVVLSQQDAQLVHEALVNAEAATALLRVQVDAALDAAANR